MNVYRFRGYLKFSYTKPNYQQPVILEGYARAGNLDLTAPWGELLLADDPRVGASVDAGGAVDVDGGAEDQKLSKGQKKRLKEQREKDIR